MNKLVALLNEYEKDGLNEFETYVERWYCERTGQILSGKWENNNDLKPCEIISKNYGFIKWLVDNDKIDFTKDNIVEFGYYGTEGYCDKYDNILMNLSIQDNPIEFLVSILK